MIEETLTRIAVALERLATTNESLLATAAPARGAAENPAPAAATPPAGGKGKSKAAAKGTPAPEPEPTPEPEPEPEKEPEGPSAEPADVRASYLKATKVCEQDSAKKIFDDFKEEVGLTKLEDMSGAQRADLKGRFDAAIAAAEM